MKHFQHLLGIAFLFGGENDRDGIKDDKDECPDTPGLLAFKGCPDRDGIEDRKDDCPDEVGTPENIGCPEVKVEVIQRLDEIGQIIFFAFDSDEITDDSYPVLDEAVVILKRYSSYSVKIQGHTDNSGGVEYNQNLSERRAASVKMYLTAKGISSSRISTIGFGELRPERTNKTEEGRSYNRRIEFKLE